MYAVKEVYLTLQGEGAHTGRTAVFCRFTGCNLWNGTERGRSTATCQFCDTDFIGVDGPNGGRFGSAADLASHLQAIWHAQVQSNEPPMVVFTGGEPALQLDTALLAECKALGFTTAVETNGTMTLPEGIDWVCVSPKSNAPLVVTKGDELKLVYPQEDCPPERFDALLFSHYFLQPMDGPRLIENTNKTVKYCLQNPRWRLSLQTHKLIGID